MHLDLLSAPFFAQQMTMNDAWWQNTTLVFWGAIVLISTVPVVCHYWCQNRRAEQEAALKREMIERGMSADEIERVLAARSSDECK